MGFQYGLADQLSIINMPLLLRSIQRHIYLIFLNWNYYLVKAIRRHVLVLLSTLHWRKYPPEREKHKNPALLTPVAISLGCVHDFIASYILAISFLMATEQVSSSWAASYPRISTSQDMQQILASHPFAIFCIHRFICSS